MPDPVAQQQAENGLTHANYLQQVKFDSTCVAHLMHIVNSTDAQIVLSTSWAMGYRFTQLNNCLRRNGIPIEVVFEWEDPSERGYMTPRRITSYRQHEISWWLDEHPDITNWVALDDLQAVSSLGPRAIVTDSQVGLTSTDAAKAIAILG